MNKRQSGILFALAFFSILPACSKKTTPPSDRPQDTRQQEKLQQNDDDTSNTDDDDASKERTINYIEKTTAEVDLGDPLKLPEKITVGYKEYTLNGLEDVVWDQTQIDQINTDKAGTYAVNGRLKDGTPVTCQVIVADKNWLHNPGFEQNDISMWRIYYKGRVNPTGIQTLPSAAKSGRNSFHFQSSLRQDFKIEQTVSGLKAGSYNVSVNIRGGDTGRLAQIYLYAIINGRKTRSKLIRLDNSNSWQTPKIKGLKLDGSADATIGIKVKCKAGGWGTIDDFSLILDKNHKK